MNRKHLILPALVLSLHAAALDFGKPNDKAPVELAQLSFLIGEWEVVTIHTKTSGEKVEIKDRYSARYVLDGYGIELVIRTVGRDGPQQHSTTFMYNRKWGQWAVTGQNQQGNAHFYVGKMKDGVFQYTQTARLFNNCFTKNRIKLYDITANSFKRAHDISPNGGRDWLDSVFYSTATRIETAD